MNRIYQLTAVRWLDVLNAHVNPLGHDTCTNSLVHNDTEGPVRHVEHTTSATVVGLVWHTALEGSIAL